MEPSWSYILPFADLRLLVASKEGLEAGSEMSVAGVGTLWVRTLSMTILIYAFVEAVPLASEDPFGLSSSASPSF